MMDGTQRALITGGTRGIGLGIAEALAQDGWHLVLNGVRAPDAVADTLDRLRERAPSVLYVQADISRGEERARLVDAACAAGEAPRLLVNNAGVAAAIRGDALEVSEESLDRLLGINLKGSFFLTQAIARRMIDGGQAPGSVVVNVTSVSAIVVSIDRAEYCISKAAGSMASGVWAAALAPFGIAVYEVRPGVVATDMTREVKERYDALIAQGALLEPRWGRPQDIGRVAAMLARGDLPYASGQVLTIDGGLTLSRL